MSGFLSVLQTRLIRLQGARSTEIGFGEDSKSVLGVILVLLHISRSIKKSVKIFICIEQRDNSLVSQS